MICIKKSQVSSPRGPFTNALIKVSCAFSPFEATLFNVDTNTCACSDKRAHAHVENDALVLVIFSCHKITNPDVVST